MSGGKKRIQRWRFSQRTWTANNLPKRTRKTPLPPLPHFAAPKYFQGCQKFRSALIEACRLTCACNQGQFNSNYIHLLLRWVGKQGSSSAAQFISTLTVAFFPFQFLLPSSFPPPLSWLCQFSGLPSSFFGCATYTEELQSRSRVESTEEEETSQTRSFSVPVCSPSNFGRSRS